MRPTRVSLAAVGFSAPILLDTYQTPPAISLAVTGSPSGFTFTYTVQYFIDDLSMGALRPVASISQAATTITVTGDAGMPGNYPPGGALNGDGGTHGLLVGDLVQIVGAGSGMDGWYNVATVVSPTSYTVTSLVSQTATGAAGAGVVSGRAFSHGTLVNLTARNTGSLIVPATAVRLNLTAWTSGTATLAILQGGMST